MQRCNILTIFLAFSLLARAQDWKVVREHPQKAFPKTVAAGNYSGIAHLHDDIYAGFCIFARIFKIRVR